MMGRMTRAAVRNLVPMTVIAVTVVPLIAGLFALGCDGDGDTRMRRRSQSAKYANSSGGELPPASNVQASRSGERTGATQAGSSGPPATESADVLERAARNRLPQHTPVGTRAQVIRCQAAMPDADLVFAPSWYAYDDRANPDTPIAGCERGDSESMLEALPWGEGRTQLCAIGWRASAREGASFPYVGMGVRTHGGLEGTRRFTIETRSTGDPRSLEVQLIMESQQHMLCGDEQKAPYAHPIVCDGSGEWTAQTVELSAFAPTWGKPAALDLMSVVSVHVQNRAGETGAIACDLRIVDAE